MHYICVIITVKTLYCYNYKIFSIIMIIKIMEPQLGRYKKVKLLVIFEYIALQLYLLMSVIV